MYFTNNAFTKKYFTVLLPCSYRKACNVTLPYYGIERLEIDFSKANLAAVVNVFTGLTVAQYLDKLWNIMDDESGEPPNTFPIHVRDDCIFCMPKIITLLYLDFIRYRCVVFM